MFNFAGQNGVFEVRQTTDKVHGKVNRQVVLHDPVYWCKSQGPTINLGGDAAWSVIFTVQCSCTARYMTMAQPPTHWCIVLM